MKKISKFIDTVNIIEVVKFLNNRLEIPENHRVIAVYDDNDSIDVKGYACVENGNEGDFPVYDLEDFIKIYPPKDLNAKKSIVEHLGL